MKFPVILAFSLAIGLLATACKPRTETAQPEGATTPDAVAAKDIPLLPVTPGDFWKYRVRIEIPAGVTSKEAASIDTTHERIRTYIGKVAMVSGQADVDCFEVVTKGSPVTREFVNLSKDRIELRGELLMKDSASRPIVFPTPVLFVRAGLKAGDALEFPALAQGNSGVVARRGSQIIGREEIEVPAGKFESIRMLMTGTDGRIESRRTLWFSPGSGIIREERVRYAEGRVIEKETHELVAKGNTPVEQRPAGEGPR